VAIDVEVTSRTCEFWVSRDGGRMWRHGLLRAPAGYPQQPCAGGQAAGDMDGGVVFGTGQNVYIAFAAKKSSDGSNHALVAHSTDGGSSFDIGTETTSTARFPKLAVQRRPHGDRLYMAGDDVKVARSDDSGRSWQPLVAPYASGASVAEATQPAVDSVGTVYIGWRQGSNIKIGRSVDAGVTWAQSQVDVLTSGGSNFPRLAVAPQRGTVYMTYGENPPSGGGGRTAAPGLVTARDHFIPSDADVMVTASTDGGRTWSPRPVRVNDDLVGNGIAQRHPNISVAPDGRVDVVWHDRRHGIGSPNNAHFATGKARLGDTYYSSSVDGGRTFAANHRITDRTMNVDLGLDYKCCTYWSYGPVSVPIGKNRVLVAWPDTREGNVDTESQQIYLGQVDLAATGPAAVQRVNAAGDGSGTAISRLAYPAGGEAVLASHVADLDNVPQSRVVVVNPSDLGVALAAPVLARAGLGTVLPTGKDGLSAATLREVQRLGATDAVLLGDAQAVPEAVRTQLSKAGVPAGKISRIAGTTPADTAAKVAMSLDQRVPTDGTSVPLPPVGAAAFDAAVVINPSSPDAAAATALAAMFRYPVLLVSRDAIPPETAAALRELAIPATYVIGGRQAISDTIAAQLPGPTRLGGADAAATSQQTAREAARLGAPTNIVYVSSTTRPFDAAMLGAAVARAGGLMLLTKGANPAAATEQLRALGLAPGVDRLLVLTEQDRAAAAPRPVPRARGAT